MTTALIVDDDAQSRYLLKCMLEADAIEVVEAANGREALALAAERPIDIVVSDILMPVMDGFTLCREWKGSKQFCEIPFIFHTGTYLDERDERFAISLGADSFIPKATEPSVTRARIRELLERRQRGEPPIPSSAGPKEAVYLQQYNSVLIRKLATKVTELEQANRALTIKDFALASSAAGILLADNDGIVTHANPAIARLCDRPAEALEGESITDLFQDSGEIKRWMASAQGVLKSELQLRSLRKTHVTLLRTEAHRILGKDGQPLGIMLSCTDVSDEQRHRQALERAHRFNALGSFAAGVAHDFNNLLTCIYGALELDGIPVSEQEHKENVAMALAAFERTRELIRRLLTFSKEQGPRRQPTDLRRLVDESVSLAMSGASVRCERHYCAEPAIALVDSGQLAQVFTNLLVNARQAMNDAGVVTISIARVAGGAAAGGDSAGDQIVVSICDTGPGIPPDVLPQMFEPYFTTKVQGSGLGLANTDAIVRQHGGRVSVRSELGHGTCFEVSLAASGEAERVPTSSATVESGVATGRVLAMDDQVAIQALVRFGLQRAGYDVVVTGNGEQTLIEFDRARAAGTPFDVVILDITVVGGLGGVETLVELRKRDPDIAVIAMTGYADEGPGGVLSGKGFTRVLAKPFLMHELVSTLRAVQRTA